jgi:hypothetical protein
LLISNSLSRTQNHILQVRLHRFIMNPDYLPEDLVVLAPALLLHLPLAAFLRLWNQSAEKNEPLLSFPSLYIVIDNSSYKAEITSRIRRVRSASMTKA